MLPTPDPARYKKRGRGWTHTPPLGFVTKRKQKSNAILLYNSVAPTVLPPVGCPKSNQPAARPPALLRRDHIRVLPVSLSLSRQGPGAFPRGEERQRGAGRFWSGPARHRLPGRLCAPVRAWSRVGQGPQRPGGLAPPFRAARRPPGWPHQSGGGPARSRAELDRVQQLDLADGGETVTDRPCAPSVIGLDADPAPVERVCVRFATPTELKAAGGMAARPEFGVLFGRLRDRISTMSSHYCTGPLDIDFRAMGERASGVRLKRADLKWERVERKSGRTGQVHSLGGFTGEAEYEGELAEFLPWLRAARWVGVGRQTVWGKGEVRVISA